jgi:hypothetical protein
MLAKRLASRYGGDALKIDVPDVGVVSIGLGWKEFFP